MELYKPNVKVKRYNWVGFGKIFDLIKDNTEV